MHKTILKKYTDPLQPGSFLSSTGFIKNNNSKNSRKILDSFEPISLHKQIKKKLPSQPIIVDDIDDIWQIDLIDIKNLRNKKLKQWYNYILVVIDVLSRYAWVRPLKTKEAYQIKDAFIDIFSSTKRRPKLIYSDHGKEFMGIFSDYLRKLKIVQKFSNSQHKAAIAERFIRTFKSKLWRMLTYHKDTNYVDYLQDLVKSYNNSYHSTIETTPGSVNNKNDIKIYEKLLDKIKYSQIDFKYKEGEYVRLPVKKNIFDKGYKQNWTKNLFIIKQRIPTTPPQYELYDIEKDSILKRYYYSQELLKVPPAEYPFKFRNEDKNINKKLSKTHLFKNKKQQPEQQINTRKKRKASEKAKKNIYQSVQDEKEGNRI